MIKIGGEKWIIKSGNCWNLLNFLYLNKTFIALYTILSTQYNIL